MCSVPGTEGQMDKQALSKNLQSSSIFCLCH